MEPVKIGIVGCGGIAKAHVNAYRAIGGNRIAWVYDVSAESAQRLAEEVGARVAPSVEWMAKEAGVDAVSVCAPPGAHVACCLPFIEAGVAVLCEKPLAATLEQAQHLAQAVRRAGSLFMTAFCYRFHPPIVKLKELIDSGVLGQPVFFQNTFSGYARIAGNHRADRNVSGGGSLIDNGAHSIDLLCHLVGEPTCVQAMLTNAVQQDLEVEDLSVMQARVGRALGQVISGYSTPACMNRLEWVGDRGAAVINFFDSSLPELVYRVAGGSGWTPVDCTGLPNRITGEIGHYLDCVRTGEPPRVTVEDGLRVNRIVAQAYASASSRVDADGGASFRPAGAATR